MRNWNRNLVTANMTIETKTLITAAMGILKRLYTLAMGYADRCSKRPKWRIRATDRKKISGHHYAGHGKKDR